MKHTLAALTTLLLVVGVGTSAFAQQGGAQGQSEAQSKVVNINTATAAQLEALPGVGAATAARIIEYREKNGAFKKVEDLMNVRGIGEKTFLNLKSLITVAPPKVTRA